MAHRLSVRAKHVSPSRRAVRSEKKRLMGMLDQLKKDASALFLDESTVSRPCSTCHGAKVSLKRGTPCRTCQGTGIKPISKQRAFEIKMVLLALRVLTPSSCREASTKEVFNHIRTVMAMSMTLDTISRILVYLERDNLVTKRREGSEALWSLTKKSRGIR